MVVIKSTSLSVFATWSASLAGTKVHSNLHMFWPCTYHHAPVLILKHVQKNLFSLQGKEGSEEKFTPTPMNTVLQMLHLAFEAICFPLQVLVNHQKVKYTSEREYTCVDERPNIKLHYSTFSSSLKARWARVLLSDHLIRAQQKWHDV